MERRQRYGESSPEELVQQAIEELKRWMQRFPTSGIGLWVIVVVVLLLWLASGLYIVGPGERGVVLLFRAATEQTEPGLRYRLPWPIQEHAVVDIAQVRRAEIGFRTSTEASPERGARGGTRTVPQEALMLTGDENIVELQFFVQYRVQDTVKFLFVARVPEGMLQTSEEVGLGRAVGLMRSHHNLSVGS